MAPLPLFNEGVRDHFPVCGTRIHYHALVIGMAPAIGAGIRYRATPLMFAQENINQR